MIGFVVVGAVIGLLIKGPAGLILGALAGYGAGLLLTNVFRPFSHADVQNQFLDVTFSVMGALCKADGVVTPEEIRVAEQYFDKLALTPEQRRSAIAAFERGKAEDYDLYGETRGLRWIVRFNRALLTLFLQIQFSAVAANGRLHQNERQKLLRVTRALGLTDVDLDSLDAMLRGQANGTHGTQPRSRPDPECAYATLGLAPSASDSEVKRAYRRLMSQYHPDKFASRGLPENMREVAQERVHEVRRAYDTIKAHRGGRL